MALFGAVERNDTRTLRLSNGSNVEATVVGLLAATKGVNPATFANLGVFVPLEPFTTTSVPNPTSAGAVRVYSQMAVTATNPKGVAGIQAALAAYFAGDTNATRLLPNGYLSNATNQALLGQVTEVLNPTTAFIIGIALISSLPQVTIHRVKEPAAAYPAVTSASPSKRTARKWKLTARKLTAFSNTKLSYQP